MFEKTNEKNIIWRKNSLIIVCDEKERVYANYLTQLIETKIVNLENFNGGGIWDIKTYRCNLSQLPSYQPILFLGMNQYTKEQMETIKEKYNKFGMHFGWLGKRAVLYVDDIINAFSDIINIKKEYNDFLNYSKESGIEHNDVLTPFIESNKSILINGLTLISIYAPFVRGTKVAYDLNKIRNIMIEQKYKTLIEIFYKEGLNEFMEG